jgi:hypothetical protein
MDLAVVTRKSSSPAEATLQAMLEIRRAKSKKVVGWLALDQFANRYVSIKSSEAAVKNDFQFPQKIAPSRSPFVPKPTNWIMPKGYEVVHCTAP